MYPYFYNEKKDLFNRSPDKEKSKLKIFKENTCASLLCVESFLNEFSRGYKYIKLYKILK